MADQNQQEPVPAQETQPPSGGASRRWRGVGLVFLCFVASVLGSGLVLLAQDDFRTITTNTTREVVSREGELIADIADEVGQSTVAITTQSVQQDPFFGGSSVQQGAGTGIIVSEDGYIVTNRHVIPEGVGSVRVTLSDDTTYEDVQVVGRDTVNDVAFLKIEGVDNLKPATLGNSSEMEVGQKVIAIGNALGQFQNTVTTGVLSGVGRPIVAQGGGQVDRLENLFQTDAAINPGNSGGPLVNLSGEVIGINTAVAEGAEGIGFAIPIDDVKGLVASVKEQGELIRPFVGVRTITLTPAVAEQLNIDAEDGAYVVENGVVEGSPADEAGVQPGDIIVQIEGEAVNEDNVITSAIAQYRVGDEITLTVQREGETRELQLTLEEFPDNL